MTSTDLTYTDFLRVTRNAMKNIHPKIKYAYYDLIESKVFEFVIKASKAYNPNHPKAAKFSYWLHIHAGYGVKLAMNMISKENKATTLSNEYITTYTYDKNQHIASEKDNPLNILIHKENQQYANEMLDEIYYISELTDSQKSRHAAYLSGKTITEIARRDGVSSQAVCEDIKKATRKLKDSVKI